MAVATNIRVKIIIALVFFTKLVSFFRILRALCRYVGLIYFLLYIFFNVVKFAKK